MKIEIKEEIIKELNKRIRERKDFKSIDEYINYILQQVVERIKSEKKETFSKEDEANVKERLKSLGYLD